MSPTPQIDTFPETNPDLFSCLKALSVETLSSFVLILQRNFTPPPPYVSHATFWPLEIFLRNFPQDGIRLLLSDGLTLRQKNLGGCFIQSSK